MASRTMHLAVTDLIEKQADIKERNRFRLGSILPDAYNSNSGTQLDTHLKVKLCNGNKMTYNLEAYRSIFVEKMKLDELYLGYYLHLVQDILFRNFVIGTYKWDSSTYGSVQRLHNDYRLLNPYIIQRYNLKENLVMPDYFHREEINQLYSFAVEECISDLKKDFEPYENGEVYFFTSDMAEEYIEHAAEVSIKELQAVYNNKTLMDSSENAWDI